MKSLKYFNKKTLTESWNEFKHFEEKYESILKVIEPQIKPQINDISNDLII